MQEDDQEFLYQVYASTRAEELSIVPWSDQEKEAFLRSQFHAQHTYYQQHYGDARFEIILCGARPAGRLYVQRREDEIRVVDISLLPEFRGQGIGATIMRNVIEEARKAGLVVRIHVEQNNPAMRLYERLGFEKKSEAGVYFLMEWNQR
jgi:ribosomal protein S18 acetylase RimI-like enzyme